MINKDDFYLKDIELCEQIEPIMQKKGIKADDMLYSEYKYTAGTGSWTDFNIRGFIQIPSSDTRERWALTYRKDSLEAALPEWCSSLYINGNEFYGHEIAVYTPDEIEQRLTKEVCNDIENLCLDSVQSKDQSCLGALARLIILLDKEGIE